MPPLPSLNAASSNSNDIHRNCHPRAGGGGCFGATPAAQPRHSRLPPLPRPRPPPPKNSPLCMPRRPPRRPPPPQKNSRLGTSRLPLRPPLRPARAASASAQLHGAAKACHLHRPAGPGEQGRPLLHRPTGPSRPNHRPSPKHRRPSHRPSRSSNSLHCPKPLTPLPPLPPLPLQELIAMLLFPLQELVAMLLAVAWRCKE